MLIPVLYFDNAYLFLPAFFGFVLLAAQVNADTRPEICDVWNIKTWWEFDQALSFCVCMRTWGSGFRDYSSGMNEYISITLFW